MAMSISMITIRIVTDQQQALKYHKLPFSIDHIASKYLEMDLEPSGDEVKNNQNVDSEQTNEIKQYDARTYRDISLEHYSQITSSVEEQRDLSGEGGSNSLILPPTSPSTLGDGSSVHYLPFYIGNHYVEVIHGILHMYKENKLTPLGEEAERSDIICMLCINADKSIHDILQFTAPFTQHILHIQIIRDSKPNQYMVSVCLEVNVI